MKFPLVGNSKVALAVENSLKAHRLPHAILIDGDIGTGRHILAEFLSRAAVCSGEDIPCGECKNCKVAANKNHPDIIFIAPPEGKKNILVDQIRELRAQAYIKPHSASGKVFLIDRADSMNEKAQNALLKVLEEPPAGVTFILIAESKAAFLPTVISRCTVLSLTASSVKDSFEDTKTALAAKEFLDFSLRGDQWAALRVLTAFEKSRPEADRLFKDLKLCIAEKIKKNPKSTYAKDFLRLYNKIQELEQLLITNISLPLLFADLTAETKDIIG